jgi:hypothetical protein
MFAVDYLSGQPELDLSNSSLTIRSYTNTLEGSIITRRTGVNTSIALEPCTTEHFSIISDIDTAFDRWGAQNWLCLPLNHIYTIQGSYGFDTKFTRINILINCSGICMNTFKDMNIKLYTLSRIVNPTNSTTQEQPFL